MPQGISPAIPAAYRQRRGRSIREAVVGDLACPAHLVTCARRDLATPGKVADAAIVAHDDIAEPLVISPATAKTHVNRTMMKLNARDRAQLVVIAYETGLIRPGPRA